MARRILHKFQIYEISACDRFAQAHAKAVIMKCDDREREPATMNELIAKAGQLADLALDAMAHNLKCEQPHLTKEQCFAKVYEDPANILLRKAERTAAYAKLDGSTIGKGLAPVATESIAKHDAAMGKLNAKADELRKVMPNLTREQAFAKVYGDPANRELATAERAAAYAQY
jgi:hypothetical protein